jgi:hypothetical protein
VLRRRKKSGFHPKIWLFSDIFVILSPDEIRIFSFSPVLPLIEGALGWNSVDAKDFESEILWEFVYNSMGGDYVKLV